MDLKANIIWRCPNGPPLVQSEFAASVVPRLPTIIILNELQNLLLNHAAGDLSLPIMMTTILKKGAFAIISRFKWIRALVKAIIEAWVYLDIQVNQPLMPIFFSKMCWMNAEFLLVLLCNPPTGLISTRAMRCIIQS